MNSETRRIACDRCRGQKLRCVRPKQAGVAVIPCERCLKTGAECTTSLSHAQRKLLLETQQSQLQPSSRIYESIPAPSTRALPVKRKSSQLFFEPSTAQTQHYPPVHFDDGTREFEPPIGTPGATADQVHNPAEMQQPLDFATESLDFGLQMSGDDFMQMFFEDPNTIPHEMTAKVNEEDTKRATAPTLAPWGSQQDCVHCLSELSSQILHDSNKMRSMPLQDILSFAAWPDKRKGQPQPGLQNGVGRLLDLTQAFLNILHYLKLAIAITDSSIPMAKPQLQRHAQQEERLSANNSGGSYSKFWVEPDLLTTAQNQISSEMPTGSSTTQVDMPTTLTILTCYIWLLHAYGTVFRCIRTALSTNPPATLSTPLNTPSYFSRLSSPTPDPSSVSTPSSTNKIFAQHIPSMLPGLHIGGFDLNSHQDMQLDIILHLSWKMLERIEKLLGISLISSQPLSGSLLTEDRRTCGSGVSQERDGNAPILNSESASALLEVMLKQDNLGYFEEVNGGAASVKQTLQDIRERLNQTM